MTLRNRPNPGVAVHDGATTTLLYAPRVHPSPLTASRSGQNPVLGSLEVVITNAGPAEVKVDAIAFTIQVGAGATLTPSTAGIMTWSSNTEAWTIAGPPAPVTSGPADYTLQPAAGTYAVLAPGTSVVVQIYGFATSTTAGTTTITVKEMLDGAPPTSGSFHVTTFPPGFYFNGLTATVPGGSDLLPVAQVDAGSPVTLVWNSSVVDVNAQTILYSDPGKGQQTATPSKLAEWTSPPLTVDTVFTLVVTTTTEGGEPLTASLSVAVGVQNPSLVAASISAGTATVSGTAVVGGALSVQSAAVTGAISAASAALSGPLSAQSAQVTGDANVGGRITAAQVNATGSLRAAQATVSGTLAAGGLAVTGAVSMFGAAQQLTPLPNVNTTYRASTDGLVLGYAPLSNISGTSGPVELGPTSWLLLPVAANTPFALLQAGPLVTTIYFIPLGSGSGGAAPVEQVS